jgi:hypothetical protein
VLDENFDGTAVNESIWEVPEADWGLGGGLSKDAVTVGDGMLSIRAFSEDRKAANGQPGTDGNPEHYIGSIETGDEPSNYGHDVWDGFSSSYGYIEARVKVVEPRGTVGAFWMLPQNTHKSNPLGDPAASGPEIDLFEYGNTVDGDQHPADGICDYTTLLEPCDEIASSTMNWNEFDETLSTQNQQVDWSGPSHPAPHGNFIDYGLLWTPSGYRMYRNGQQVYESTEAITNSPEYMLLTNNFRWENVPAAGYGTRAQQVAQGVDPIMQVDYVHVWQRPISEIPDQQIGLNSAIAVPFNVMDYFSSASSGASLRAPLGGVWVSASANGSAVVPDGHLAVTGNPSPSPGELDGSYTNGDFESALGGSNNWASTGAAALSTTKEHGGNQSLRLGSAAGSVEQVITGLQANTTYAAGLWRNLDGSSTSYDWGVQDVDASLSGDQKVSKTDGRLNGKDDKWIHSGLTFTTGPSTTQVKVFITKQGTGTDYVDDLVVRPLTPANRTVVVRPADNQYGEAEITLTARDLGNNVLGTETFKVNVSDYSSYTNGKFDSLPRGTGWELYNGADMVAPDLFTLDRKLALATGGSTAVQHLTGLKADQQYDVHVKATVNPSPTGTPNDLAFAVSNYGGGPQVTGHITQSTPNGEGVISFTPTGTSGLADLFLLDWDPSNGTSVVDYAIVDPNTGVAPQAYTPPALDALGPQRLTASAPSAVAFKVADGVTVSSVKSDNQYLLPDSGLAAPVMDVPPSYRGYGVLSLTPRPDRTGNANVTVATSAGDVTIPVTVSDDELGNPGFEQGTVRWGTSASGTAIVTSPAASLHSGAKAIQLSSGGSITQRITGLDFNTPFVLDGYVKGTATVTVKRVPDEWIKQKFGGDRDTPNLNSTFTASTSASWSGSDWTSRRLSFSTPECRAWYCNGARGAIARLDPETGDADPAKNHPLEYYTRPGGQVDITITDDTTDPAPVLVDDLQLMHAPRIGPIRELSLTQNQTDTDWFNVGRIGAGAFWQPQISSSNPSVVPASSVQLVRQFPWVEYRWGAKVTAGTTTGSSDITITLTDPATGVSSSATFTVRVNAGSFNVGDLQRSGTSGYPMAGWASVGGSTVVIGGTTYTYNDISAKQMWGHLGPTDDDKILHTSRGWIATPITGLVPNHNYKLQFSARGNDSEVGVWSAGLFSHVLGATQINWMQQSWKGDYSVTFETVPQSDWDGTSMTINIVDHTAEATPLQRDVGSCVNDRSGESCFDDFVLIDLGPI